MTQQAKSNIAAMKAARANQLIPVLISEFVYVCSRSSMTLHYDSNTATADVNQDTNSRCKPRFLQQPESNLDSKLKTTASAAAAEADSKSAA